MGFTKVVPILRIFDVDKAHGFYVGWLGCRIDWEHRTAPGAPLYLQVARDSLVLHLSEHHGDACPGAAVLIQTDALDALHEELTAKPYPFMRPGIEDAPWAARVMELIDPFGNRLRFWEPAG
jgi:catechol 2,3-dioxygenase-like lactoylglutathione lyase family enzyme